MKAARTPLPQQQSRVQDSARRTGETDEQWRCSHRAHDPRDDGNSQDRSHPVNDSASRSSERNERVRRRTQSRTSLDDDSSSEARVTPGRTETIIVATRTREGCSAQTARLR